MPSGQPLPTVEQLVQQAAKAVTGEKDRYGDIRSGALYNHAAGPMAILYSREAQRDKDLFSDDYFDSATGWALTRLVQQRFSIARVLDTFGQGTCLFRRTSASAGNGSLLQGTRIQVTGAPPAVYVVAQDTTVTGLTANVPVQASTLGAGVAINTINGLSLVDPVYDPLWLPAQLIVADGTVFEEAAAYRARTRAELADSRNGYIPEFVTVCQAQGASYIIPFPSQYGLAANDFTDDFGLNAVYVADANYQSPQVLITACAIALEGVRILGADLWVGGISTTQLSINALLTLTDDPGNLPLVSIRRAATQALLAAFGATGGGYLYKRSALLGAMAAASPYIQTAGLPTQWVALSLYELGDVVVPSPLTGQTYQCSVAGTSGGGQPAFPTVQGNTVTDGTVVWTCTQYPSLGIFAGGSLQLADPTLVGTNWPANLTRYTLAGAGITLAFAGPV